MSNHRHHNYREYDGFDWAWDGLGILALFLILGVLFLALTPIYS